MSNYIIPIFILLICLFPFFKKKKVYKSFIDGCTEGINLCIKLFPYMLSMIFATSLLKVSNLLSDIFKFVKNVPIELITQGLFRSLSANASLASMLEIYNKFGVDSKEGIISSILQGSTDTTIYVITLYFGSVSIVKYKYALKVGLLVDLIGFIICILIYMFILK